MFWDTLRIQGTKFSGGAEACSLTRNPSPQQVRLTISASVDNRWGCKLCSLSGIDFRV